MIALHSSRYRDPNREHLLHDGAELVDLIFRCADRWLEWRRTETKVATTRATVAELPTPEKFGGKT